MITVPQDFINDDGVKKILLNGKNGLVHTTKASPTLNQETYLSQHALIYVMKGSLLVKTDYASSTVNSGQIVFLPIGVYQFSELVLEGAQLETFTFFFDEKLARRFLGNVSLQKEKKEPEPLIVNESAAIKSYLSFLLKNYSDRTEKNATNWKLLELLNLIEKTDAGEKLITRLNRAQNRKKYGIRLFVEKHFHLPLSIEDYAHLTGRSISTFHRDFKKQYAVAPKKWFLTKRMEMAKNQLIQQPTLKVAHLAISCGYDNTSHFIKAFQKEFGITPKQLQLSEKKEAKV
ncbi:MAG: AraC family transcriptional regulator [Cyclobacteriaceae bacterium]